MSVLRKLSQTVAVAGVLAISQTAMSAGTEVYGHWENSAGLSATSSDNRTFNLEMANSETTTLKLDLLGAGASGSSLVNVSQGKSATQSSTWDNVGVASRAVDGNTDGDFNSGNSVTATNSDTNAWFEVDLGASYPVEKITLWNRTDCCSERLANFYLFVSDQPLAGRTLSDIKADASVAQVYQAGAVAASKDYALAASGRYVRVQLETAGNFLSLAEVQVFAGISNVAKHQPAQQSSTWANQAPASRAVDGNTDGNFNNGSVTATDNNADAWWEVDLGASQSVKHITLYNRTDCCSERLANFNIFVSDQPFAGRSLSDLKADTSIAQTYQSGAIGASKTYILPSEGRYIRVQLETNGNYLGLAEVEVFAAKSPAIIVKDAYGNVLTQAAGTSGSSVELPVFLAAGSYQVVAASSVSGVSGEFALSTTAGSLSFEREITLLPITNENMQWRYYDSGTDGNNDLSIWRPGPVAGYHSLGDVAMGQHKIPAGYLIKDDGDLLAAPIDYIWRWNDSGSGGAYNLSLWEPIAPAGYTCLGAVSGDDYSKPSTNIMRCVKNEYLLPAEPTWVWNDAGTGSNNDGSVWGAKAIDYRGQATGNFTARTSHHLGAADMKVLNKSALDNVRIGDVTSWHVTNYAPKIYLHGSEAYWPSSVEDFLANTHEEVIDGTLHLVTNQALGCTTCTDPQFLDGKRPDQHSVPIYAFIESQPSIGPDVVDVDYWAFYPYNNGKKVCIGAYIGTSCIGGYEWFGNHVGDWEHTYIRFVKGLPSEVYMSVHAWGGTIPWGDPSLSMDGSHMVVYQAEGSHGTYALPGGYRYQDLPNGDYLMDYARAGVAWDTWNNVVEIPEQANGTYTGSLEWVNFPGRWGNGKGGCGLIEDLSGECLLNNGPYGPTH